MTQSISTATSQSKITLTQLMNFKTPEDKTIFEAKEKWLEQLNQIPDNQRATYRTGIDRVLQELDTQCTILRGEGYKSHEIVAELSKTISLYNTSYALFYYNTIAYNQHKLAEEQKHASLKEQFGSAGRSFKVYHLPEHTPTDPYEAQAQFQALVVLGTVHTVGTALQLTGATVAEGAKRACKLTKTTETACRATLDFGKKVVDAIPIDIKAAIQDVQARGEAALAEVLEEHYKFPKEQAKQLAYQNMDDLLIVSTAGVTGVASSLAIKTGKCFFNKQAPAATATASEGASSATATAAAQEPVNAYFGTSTNFVLDKGSYSLETQPYYVQISEIPSTASGTPSAFAAEPGHQLFQLGRPNNVNTTFERVKEHIETTDAHQTMGTAIGNEQRILNFLVPDISSEGKKILDRVSFQEMWKSPWNQATILIDINKEFIRKEFQSFRNGLSEFMGLCFLRSLDLDRTALAEPVAFWTHQNQATLIKTSLPGAPLREWMNAVGELPVSSNERITGVGHLKRMAFSSGRSVGELQTKGAHFPPLPESELASAARSIIADVENDFSTIHSDLGSVGKRLKTDPREFLEPIYTQLEGDPGPVSYAFGNVYGSEFLFSLEADRPFACLNTKDAIWNVNSKGVPNQLIAEEHALFRRIFRYDGFKAGLEFSEIKEILQAFEMGYHLEYRGPAPSQAASRVYDLYASLQTLNFSVNRLQGVKDPRMHRLIDSQVNQLDQKLRTYSLDAKRKLFLYK